ncbi:ABC transporter permease [Arcicella sp. DC2W]|uniref:ABC transporter permease n=1 Tax=Arcicella gelida TaxID=2984195 RepID=A0ABU5S1G7_9BACT|nr:ABC transporter permease [Arcicella sp. DC2W]MEA5402316.1 ABC transporter permease [Arcicella sp. DC2W]
MFRNYLKIAIRNLVKNKVYSFINIGGLAVGMAVAMLIGLWIHDELSFNKYHKNYDKIAQVMQHQTFNGEVGTQTSNPYLLGAEIREKYGSDFKFVLMSSGRSKHILKFGDKKLSIRGEYIEADAPEMLSLKMLKGTNNGLKDPSSILINESTAKAFFGDANPLFKSFKIDNKFNLKVTGVYEDIPHNSDFHDLAFIAPWDLYIKNENWDEKLSNPWRSNAFQTYAQLADNADVDKVSAKIKNVKLNKVDKANAAFKPEVFLHPMKKWHLYSAFKNGVNTGGQIEFVWLFAIIGIAVLLLACINFMNLSTARSEKRAKEVGVRKAIGSIRGQLITQFLTESFLVVMIAFILSLLLVELSLPTFNEIADKKISILFTNPLFWLLGLGFSLITGFVAGSYPALYLSSFQPVKVLKGTFRIGHFASMPRKVLVVMQFTVSITLIIGTIIVFNQIQFAKNRPIGYNKDGLLAMFVNNQELIQHYNAIRNDLIKTGAVSEMSESSSPTTGVWAINNGYDWKGKDPNVQGNFGTVAVTHDFGKTVGWQFKEGRDFSRAFSTDSTGVVLNEAAVKFMGMKQVIGETMKVDGKPYKIIGVVKDMVMNSPYQPALRTVFILDYKWINIINIKINPKVNSSEALSKIESVFKKYAPDSPFDYWFVDDDYNLKFLNEVRIGKLTSFFAVLAIFISCLGLFGLASFVVEQRTKEIGIRKVLGATVLNLWTLLSKEFVLLVLISLLTAVPIAYYYMNNWLQSYEYRTEIPWWIFALSGLGALIITLLTVSFQAIKAALANPVKSLRTE